MNYADLGRDIRLDIIDIVAKAGRGHISSAFSLIEILLVLYEKILKIDPEIPDWVERDRLILSKGHGCLALYAILARKGFFPRSELWKFCEHGSILGGHPDHTKVPGVEASTGALGHGLSVGIGMALAARMNKKVSRSFVILGDGECNEGTVWEAAMSAAKHQLNNLVVLIDYNKMQSYGYTSEVLELEPFIDKWQAFGFECYEVNMDYPTELEKILFSVVLDNSKPIVIICHTIKGKGISFMEQDLSWHHRSRLTVDEIDRLRSALRG